MIKRRDVISKIDRTLRFIRGFEECIECMAQTKAVPLPLCYQRSKSYYKFEETTSQDSNIYLFNSPCADMNAYFNFLNNFEYLNSDHVLDKNIIEYLVSNNCTRINSLGKWILVTKIKFNCDTMCSSIVLNPPLWLLKYRYGEDDQPFKLTEITDKINSDKFRSSREWINYLEASYNLIPEDNLNERFKPNLELMQSISKVPKNWTIENDEELAELLKDIINTDTPGSIRNLIKNISVPSQPNEDTENLISLDRRSYWEFSDCYDSMNVIKISLKPEKKIRQLYIVVCKKNRRYMPKEVQVYGGEGPGDVVELNKIIIKPHEDGDILILENCSKVYDYLEIRIKSNQRQGTYTRVYGVKMFLQSEGDENLPSEIFLEKNLKHTHPRLSNFKPTFLYRRAEILIRFIKLFDFCMDAILPTRTYDNYFQNLIKSVKKLLILSSRRLCLLEKIISSVPTSMISMPIISIDRPLAFAYRGKAELDPKYQNTIFMQIFNCLSTHYNLDYRWDKNADQWWECKFIGEGIIDQGGGFRDSLSDIAEEMCPNTPLDSSVPLPFFIRSPNQHQSDMNTFKDTFIPNPSCVLFNEYEFIGKLMGACYRSKETLALYLSPLFWKKLSGEKIIWKNDFITVDAAQVELLESIEKMNKEEYEFKYSSEITWSCVLSDGSLQNLQPNGHLKQVGYEERLEYCEQVKNVRLSEADKQIDAIRKGLISVLSIHVLYILTSQEFELEICGAPEISVEDLKMSTEYDDELTVLHDRVIHFWEAIKSFTNEERSKFVRFVTGRKRLPVKIFFSCSDQPPTSFPDSSTCSCSIYFPEYPNAQIATEKLRYAIHNCVAIDTDNYSYGEDE